MRAGTPSLPDGTLHGVLPGRDGDVTRIPHIQRIRVPDDGRLRPVAMTMVTQRRLDRPTY